jgi:hypothetical protein
MGELNFQTEFILQFLNTPGTEVAPGSNVVRKNFKRSGLCHDRPSCGSFVESIWLT